MGKFQPACRDLGRRCYETLLYITMSRDQALSLVIINYFLVTSPVLTFDLPFTIISKSKLKYVFQMQPVYLISKLLLSLAQYFHFTQNCKNTKTVHTDPLYTKGEIGARRMTAKGWISFYFM